MDALNRELGLTQGQLRLSNQQVEQKNQEANEWARKYHELLQKAKFIQDSNITSQAENLVRQGKLKEADDLLKRSTISMAQYEAIQDGMDYQQVVRIFGRPGVEKASGGPVASYGWSNADGSMVSITFINGQKKSKAQHGLR